MDDTQESTVDNSVLTKNKKGWGALFGDKEEMQLLTIWASTAVQNMFKKNKKHNLVYEHIAREHNKIGNYNRSANVVQSKIKNSKTRYRNSIPKSGGSPPSWPSYEIIHRVLGQKGSTTLHNLQDSLSTTEDTEFENRLLQLSDADLLREVDSQRSENQSQSEADSLQPPVNVDANVQFQRIKRPPRRTQSREAQLLETLLEDRRLDEERLKKIEEREARAEEREQAITNNFNEFLKISSVLMKHQLKEKCNLDPDINNFSAPTSSLLDPETLRYSVPLSGSSGADFSPAMSTIKYLEPLFPPRAASSPALSTPKYSDPPSPNREAFSPAKSSYSEAPSPNNAAFSPESPRYHSPTLSRAAAGTTGTDYSPSPSTPKSPQSPTLTDEYSKKKKPKFSPAPMKTRGTVNSTETWHKKVMENEPRKSKFTLKVKTSEAFYGRYRIEDVRKNLFDEVESVPNNNEENTSAFLSLLDEDDVMSDTESQVTDIHKIEESVDVNERTENIKSPLKDQCQNQEAKQSPQRNQNNFWRSW